MIELLDVGRVALELGSYSMSWLELVATILYFVSVLLAIRPHVLTWPTGIVANLLLFALFFQIRLYSDMLLQVWFVAISLYGWWLWRRRSHSATIKIDRLSNRGRLGLVILTLSAIMLLGASAARLHLWLPTIFQQPASFAYADASTTVLSIVATILLAKKKIESWVLWIVVDIVCIALYTAKGVLLMAAEYGLFLAMAAAGLHRWQRILRSEADEASDA